MKPGFTTTRQRLGLSQQQLAEHLGISKAAIGMAETGKRNLPVAALIKLAQLEIKMAAAEIPAVHTQQDLPFDTPMHARKESIEIRELECELQIQKLTMQLESKTTQYQVLTTQLTAIEALLKKEEGTASNMFTVCLELHRDRLQKQLSKCSVIEQTLLRNKIALLSAESHLNKSVRQSLI